jgi:hypothetical protein
MCLGVGLYLAQVTGPLKKTVAMDVEINCKNPTACALAENQTAITAAGNPRHQIKWGIETNMSVMCYHFKANIFLKMI